MHIFEINNLKNGHSGFNAEQNNVGAIVYEFIARWDLYTHLKSTQYVSVAKQDPR